MSDRIQQAFDKIKAEESLKEQTLQYIYGGALEKAKPKKKYPVRRMSVAFATVFILVLAGGFSYRVYASPEAYVDVDINPSIELTINRFDRVIDVYAYNEDGKKVLSGLKLKNKTTQEAMDLLLLAIEKEGYMEDSQLLSITVQSDKQQQALLELLQQHVDCTVSNHHSQMSQEIFAVDENTKEHAYSMNVSPAQYLAIQELQKADPSVTVEECQNHTISELREITSEHQGTHHSTDSPVQQEENPQVPDQESGEKDTQKDTEGHQCPDSTNCHH